MANGSLSNADMLAIVHAHGAREFALDLDGAMSHLSPNVWWEQHNMGLRAEGAPAVREWYRRLLPKMIPLISDTVEKNVSFGDDRVILDTEFTARFPDGSSRRVPGLYVYHFDNGMIVGERVFHSDEYSPLYRDALGDIECFPGIRRV